MAGTCSGRKLPVLVPSFQYFGGLRHPGKSRKMCLLYKAQRYLLPRILFWKWYQSKLYPPQPLPRRGFCFAMAVSVGFPLRGRARGGFISECLKVSKTPILLPMEIKISRYYTPIKSVDLASIRIVAEDSSP